MDVYLIPVGADRYELYCEQVVDEAPVHAEAPPGSGRFAAMLHRFNAAVAHAEHQKQHEEPGQADEGGGWQERWKRRMLCWIAERVAEQQLLWRIRKEADVTLVFPDDVTGERALAMAHDKFRRERDRHLKWAIIDGALFCASGIVALVPGPNLLAYYFGFRFIGHFLSRRGAKHAVNEVRWECRESTALTELRLAVPVSAPDRERRVQEVAAALHLQHLPTFFARTAVLSA